MTARNEALELKYGARYKWFAVLAVIIGLLASIFSSTMINVALTNIMAAYDITQASAQWMSTAYFSASTVCMLSSAWLMHNYGARPAFLLATVLFFSGSMLGQFAPDFNLLIFARVLQGSGAGILQPLTMALVFRLFPANLRGTALGTFSMVIVLGPAIGPTIGGIITDTLDWHFTFTAALPLSFLGGVLGWKFLPDTKDAEISSRFNYISFLLIAMTVASFLIGLSDSQFHGFSDIKVITLLCTAAIGLTLFIVREIKSSAPLLRLNMFRNLYFTSTVLIAAITSAGMFSSIYMLPLFARTVQLTTATDAGLMLLPGGLTLALISPISGRMVDRMPAHRLLLAGILLFIVASYAISYADQYSSFWFIAGWLMVSRGALGLILPSNNTLSLSSMRPEQVPQASGALNFCRMLGGTTGVNVIAVLITAHTAHYRQVIMEETHRSVLTSEETVQALVQTFQDCFLIACLFFALALIPVSYIIYHTHTKKPHQ
ncbi:DHA2 family efflux MFS transporter permease subunit [Sneathiella sp.]|uniref:DHA2 family efflux MFS transporter permease subunit n=1 Tax=Sneathiella sp. TaxID=1964365 RepID=UPI0035645F77